ncbi:lipase [Rhodococcus sp. WMMA185]|uniref:lipase family protein n=1 Tax=Rhodococcus sp. WMMA185 TaxID=679318 RepID=UPI0008781DE7|nr:lipase family protein [Rhodococcus sp. WMMA185]AOW92787.1 lipase [Rhodococcus sp. WMMA185]
MNISRWGRGAALVLGVSLALVTAGTAPAASAPTDFYAVPTPLPEGSPGDVLKSESYPPALTVPNQVGPWPSGAQRIMYRSTDAHGNAVAVTGTYFDASVPWTEGGPRPLVVLAPGTQGQGDQCAPSKLFSEVVHYTPPLDFAVEYETTQAYALLSRGMDVVVTDYEGLGTPGIHSYTDRRAEGYAVLDAARAVTRLPGTRIGDDSPIGLWGYSQGGGATASAAELQGTYAPELNIRGTYAGGPPADLRAVAEKIDGGLGTGLLGYSVNAFYAGYPEIRDEIDSVLSPYGRETLDDIATQCVPETTTRYGLHRTSEWTTDGRTFAELIDTLPKVGAVIDEQRIGRVAPPNPVLIAQGRNDDLVPYEQARTLADDWCRLGATVEFSVQEIPPIAPGFVIGHVLPAATVLPHALDWMTARFTGAPAPSTCNT